MTAPVSGLPVLAPGLLATLSADDLARLWEEVQRRAAVSEITPDLRAALLERCASLPHEIAETIRADLEHGAPSVVLEAHWRDVIPNIAAIGAYRAEGRPAAGQTHREASAAWVRENPRRLAKVVERTARITDNLRTATRVAFDVAEAAGISPDVSKPIIMAALRPLWQKEAHRRGR